MQVAHQKLMGKFRQLNHQLSDVPPILRLDGILRVPQLLRSPEDV